VDHVFLTDNNSKDAKGIITTLTTTFPSEFLTIIEERRPKAQLKAYAWCAEEQRMHYNWIAFFDMDEFLVLRGNDAADPSTGEPPKLKSFLDRCITHLHVCADIVLNLWPMLYSSCLCCAHEKFFCMQRRYWF
jgi:hypothetical protein